MISLLRVFSKNVSVKGKKYEGDDAIVRNTYITKNMSNRVDKRYFIRVLNNNFDCSVS